MTQCAVFCQNVCKQCSLPVNNNKATPTINYKGEILLHITGYPMIDMTTKLGQSTDPITNMYTSELHVCKQQHMPTAN